MRAAEVVLVHGFGGHRWMIAPLAGRLRQAGFASVNWGYRSLWGHIAAFGRPLRSEREPTIGDVRTIQPTAGELCDHPQVFAAQLPTSMTADYSIGYLEQGEM